MSARLAGMGDDAMSSPAMAIIAASRACAPAIRPGISRVSGMSFQYLRGISLSIAPTFSRAGLKIEA